MVCLAYSYTTRILWEIKNILCLYDVRIQIVVVSDRYIYRDEMKQKFINQNNIRAIIIIITHYCARYQKNIKGWKEETNIFQTPQELILLRLLNFFLPPSLPPSRKKVRNPACIEVSKARTESRTQRLIYRGATSTGMKYSLEPRSLF